MCYMNKCYCATVLVFCLGFFVVQFGFCFGGLVGWLVFVVFGGVICCFVVFLKAYNNFAAQYLTLRLQNSFL